MRVLVGTFINFMKSAVGILPEMTAPSLPDALWRLGLILSCSLLMIVVLTTLDSTLLYLYVSNARVVA